MRRFTLASSAISSMRIRNAGVLPLDSGFIDSDSPLFNGQVARPMSAAIQYLDAALTKSRASKRCEDALLSSSSTNLRGLTTRGLQKSSKSRSDEDRLMKDLSSGKTYLTQRTRSVAGPAFARVGIDINHLRTEKQIMIAWSSTLNDSEAESLLAYLTVVS